MEQVGASDFWFLPNRKAIVIYFEEMDRYEELSDTYDEFPNQREQAAEFFCRVMNTVVEEAILTGIFPVDDEGHEDEADQ